ncbi:MAG: hypothetical protein D6730_06960 [Bacteroidetes bacterium]|nr:MAG: hypothetical protein D6730_06960 [Bacteroidota bacterium]
MRYVICLLAGWCLYIGTATPALAQEEITGSILEQKVVAAFDQRDMLEILYELEQKYPVYFFYKEEWIPRDKRNIAFVGIPLASALQKLFEGTNLGFMLVEKNLIVVARRLDLMDIEAFSYSEFVETISSLDKRKSRFNGQTLIVGDSLIRPLPAVARLSGVLYNFETDEKLAGGQLAFPGLQTGTFSDSSGRYEITLPTGTHEVRITAPGHEELSAQMRVFSDGELDIELSFTSYQLEEVLLAAESTGQSTGSAISGRVNISMIDVNRMPPLMGEVDIINTILLKPGVTTSGEASSGFNIRGGNVDQNLILYGGNMIFNSSHLLGFFSVFNPEVVESVSLFKGHIPAQYGGRISSVLDVQVADGSYRKFSGSANIGLLSSKLHLNGPISSEKTSYNAAFRFAYPSLLTRNFRSNLDIAQSRAYYWDGVAKISHKLSDFGSLSVQAYASQDHFKFAQNFGYDWSNLLLSAKWQQIYSSKLSTRLELSAGQYESTLFFETKPDSFTNTTGINNYQLNFNTFYSPNSRHNISLGLVATFYDVQPDRREFDASTNRPARIADKDQGLETALYLNDEFRLNDLVSFSAGLRLSMFNNMGPYTQFVYADGKARNEVNITDSIAVGSGSINKTYLNLEPRLSVRVFLDDESSLKASYNRTSQYVHLLSNTASIAPVDIWQVSNPYFPAQRSDNLSLGFFKDFKQRQWQASLELFYRTFSGQMVSKDFASLLNNRHIETEVLNARGRAYGAEFSIGLKTKIIKVDGAFTFMRSLRQTLDNPEGQGINDNSWFPADFDSPLNASLTAIWTPNLWQSFSANFVFRSGRPISQPLGVFPAYPAWNIPAFSQRNNARIPDYHRLDISYSFEPGVIKRRRTKTKVVISVYNIYARKNPFSVFFQNEDGKFKAFQLSVLGTALPFIGYNISF